MAEKFDEYIDAYLQAPTPYGVAVTFLRSAARPSAPGSAVQRDEVGTIRMSWEHFKLMAFLMRRTMLEVEQQTGAKFPVTISVLNELRIAPEDWEKFWKIE